jgi:anti-anti-sigma regulatory factor
MLKINRTEDEKAVAFALSGRLAAENLAELKTLLESEAEGRPLILDLENITLVDRDAVKFLKRCEADSIQLKNCPAYIREWIAREREKQSHLG